MTIGSPVGFSVHRALPLAPDVAGDDRPGGGEDVAGRAVVLLEADGDAPGIVDLEVEDVADLGAAPAVDRLVVVADDAEVVMAGGEVTHQLILDAVGVLEFVDEEVMETLLPATEDLGVRLEEFDGEEDKIAEIEGIGLLHPRLIELVDLGDLLAVKIAAVEVGGKDTAVLGTVDRRRRPPRLEGALADIEFGQDLLEEPLLILIVTDGKVALIAESGDLAPEDAHAGGMKGAHPRARSPPTSCCTRRFISAAALLVKVTARMRQGSTPWTRMRWAMRWVRVRVLPEPAPARMRSGPSPCSTAWRCCRVEAGGEFRRSHVVLSSRERAISARL